ncbi:hypothetical protein [Burkholderia ubonensis]|uniref:hypothetical protein n=1 Tax=Burkholderia ubonensis TaxID=101571 RepID=UPI000A65882D|nr:hypothetical protein [Burkholderia ubonensis]
MKRILISTVLALTCAGAFAQSIDSAGSRVGLGQDSAREPAKLKNLRLSDPLVQQKYLNEPDMLRFLRGTYSEACTRGLVKNAADNIRLDAKGRYTDEQKKAAKLLVESNRVWKMTSFEMEALYGAGYLNAANYCDCIMKEVSDQDLVNPKKGLDAVEKISKPAQTACEQNAQETTKRQMDERKKADKKN